MIIDAHQHFWRPARGDYGWLTPDLPTLYRDFMPTALAPILGQQKIDGTILVQAAPTVAETEFLLEIADETPFVYGVVGWVDFDDTNSLGEIARLAKHPKLVGLRPMIQDIVDDDWMLRPNLAPILDAMIQQDLAFDALVLPRHLPNLREFLARYPNLRVVIDHGAKPEIANGHFDDWANDMMLIAREGRTYCKLSGLLTEAGEDWNITNLEPYVAHLFKHFGTQRLIWGSDWPVLTLATSYDKWLSIARTFVPDASEDAIFGQNARDFYRL
jgi:L-fuconolactonase